MDNCVFCQIAKKEIPAETVYEGENFLAFLDIKPQSPGHTLVIPKKHFRWVWQVPDAGAYFELVKKIALAQQKAFNQEAIWAKIMGDEVEHAHIWVFPHPATAGNKTNFRGNGNKIRRALSL